MESAFALNETNYCVGAGNYYHISPIDFNFYSIDALEAPYKLEVLCFENLIGKSSIVKSPEIKDKLLNNLVGFYTDGNRKSFITYNPPNSKFYVVNSSGEDSEVLIFGSRVYAKMWKLYGNLDIDNSSIEWDNGSVYLKLSK